MKSKQRHELETNVLAKHLGVWIEKYRPYFSTIAGVLIAIVVVMFVWSLFSGQSTARQGEAWNSYETAVGTVMLVPQSLEQLQQTAEEYPGTDAQTWANVTWADGQVLTASSVILQDRASATEALDRAASAYRSVIASSQDQDLVNRARFGLARVFEMRNDPETARDYYRQVEGAFATLARQRAEVLDQEKTKQALDWLAVAQATPLTSGAGPRPEFGFDDLALPGAGDTTDPGQLDVELDELLKDIEAKLNMPAGEEADRYAPGGETSGEEESTTESETPAEQQVMPTGEADNAGGESESTEPADAETTPSDQPTSTEDDEPPTGAAETGGETTQPEK